jgi:hypothetical protein
VDYTLKKYRELCRAISQSRYSAITLAQYLANIKGIAGKSCIVLRHDIDRSPQRALSVAEIEYEFGIPSSYYFRVGTFLPQVMDRILACGHEIGFHYETLDKCRGSIPEALVLFKEQLAVFREKYGITTVCAHGNPLTRYDNKDIWKHMQFKDCLLLGEAFLSLDFSSFAYFSDSGRTWRNTEAQKMPGKDSVVTAFDNVTASSTDDVIRIIEKADLPNICLLTHPERWCGNPMAYVSRFLIDKLFSTGKEILFKLRAN